jgi:hypothetical protein
MPKGTGVEFAKLVEQQQTIPNCFKTKKLRGP